MRRSLLALTPLVLAACSNPVPFQNPVTGPIGVNRQGTGSHQLVSIHWRNPDELAALANSGLDVFAPDHRRQEIQGHLSTAQVVKLQQQGVQVRLQPQLARVAEDRQAFPGGYMTYAQLKARLQALAQAYPQLVRLEDVGDTWEKQQGKADHDIWAVHLNGQQRAGKQVVLMTGGVHARELAPVEILMKLLDLLSSGYGKDPRITQLLNTRELVIMPMVNVDGRVKVEQGAAWQRKNTHGSGIDLNRNFDNHWNYAGLNVPASWKSGLMDPNSEIFSGSGPASEPETQIVQAMMQKLKPVVFVDMHSYGELMLWPLGYSSADIPQTPAYRELFQKTMGPLGFQGGNSPQILYPTTSTTRDYAYERLGAMSMTLEIGDDFRPSYQEVEQMWTKMNGPLLTILEAKGL
ncbi:MAG: M14 family zinc carboxypeptidase [Candidatus Sericytochromatia bacterium]